MKEDIKNKAYQLATMLGEMDNEIRRTGRVDMSVDEFNEIYGLATDINEELNEGNTTPSEIEKVVEIANNMGLDAFTDEYTEVDTDQEMVSIQVRDENSGMIVSIDVAPDASKKDLSDELYMLADDFNEEFVESDKIEELKEEGYTDNQIDTMRRYINLLYKNYTFG